jgi:hypothetical protein
MKIYPILILILSTSMLTYGQSPTIGLTYSTDSVSPGYTLFTPSGNQSAFLVNECGEKVQQWTFSESPGATCYLLENGNLLRAGSDSLEIRDWNNTLLWSYPTTANGLAQHHDIEPLPNGNVLILINDIYTAAEIIDEGRDPSTVVANFKLDRIVELEPVGTNQANIVWEWKFFDHLIQDFDSTMSNYGDVSIHPELIDLNFDNGETNDYTHVNGIDYNANLDQILLSTRHLSELHIIDHSTTTIQAANHTGGNGNMGGDILWRWGNPSVYVQGTLSDQKLFKQHDGKWVADGYLDEGKISVFNNLGVGTGLSSYVHLIEPDVSGSNYTMSASTFNPTDFDWSWNGTIMGDTMYQGKKSGCHSLPNGNFVICQSSIGQISEITKAGTHVWSYTNPSGPTTFTQFSDPNTVLNSIFRGEKYPVDYVGFSGQTLTPLGTIEAENSISDTCLITTNIFEPNQIETTLINPVRNNTIEYHSSVTLTRVTLKNMLGQRIASTESQFRMVIPNSLNSGIYLIQFEAGTERSVSKVVIP